MRHQHLQPTLSQWAVILIAVPLLAEIILLAWLNWLMDESERLARLEEHSKAVVTKANELVQLYFDVGIAFILYDAKTIPFFEQRYVQLANRIPTELKALHELVKGNPAHNAIVTSVANETEVALMELSANTREIKAGGRLDLMRAYVLKKQLDEIRDRLNKIAEDEQKTRQQDPESVKRSKWMVKLALWLGVATSIVIALMLFMMFNRITARRVKRLMENSIRLGKGTPLGPVLKGNDEIARLDLAFHDAAAALHESARKQRAVIDNAVDVICSIDADGKFTALSPAAQELWGYTPEDLLGSTWLSLIDDQDRERSLKWSERVRDGVKASALENRVRRKDGSLVDMLWSAHWSDTERSLFCVAHDITERKELERFKQQFVAMISHDLRTPLMAVQSTLALIGADAYGHLSDQGSIKISRAENNLRHTISLINNLLDLEKMESGKMELSLAPTMLVPLLQRCAASVAPLAESRSIQIALPTNDVEVMADAGRLSQVVINLLGNALKFSPEGSEVSVSLSPGPWVTVSISDQGPGIPSPQQNLIFERFHQVSSAGKRTEGTGLGLAICKAIIEAHGGTIGVESQESKGSTFWFRIPAHHNAQ